MKQVAFDYCDNTDCEMSNVKQLLYLTILRKEFNNDKCYWCYNCCERDKEMIKF